MKVNRKKLFKLYMRRINKITEECEDKSVFEPEEIIGIVADVLEENTALIKNEN